ncbi:DUF885 family protein [Mycoplasmoides alvi]|uniref:DUF885 family protein n=1 Tax=Mycoplasmoides alvi TaxID=78580 RepID=UPI00051AF599|nr:DUF885 family protein [Mycoplasmoides alvi]
MKKRKISKISLSLLMSTLMISSISIVSISCNNVSDSQRILTLNNDFISKEHAYLQNDDSELPIFNPNNPNPESVFDSLISNSQNAINALKNLKNELNLTTDESIWIDSFIFQWQNKINNIKAGIIYLGANPIRNKGILSSSSNHINDYVKSALNIYPLNDQTGDPDLSSKPDKDLVLNLSDKLAKCKDILNNYKNIMNYGADRYGYMPSTIAKKYLIYQFLTTFYMDQINTFASSSNQNSISIKDLLNIQSNKDDFETLSNTINNIDYLDSNQKSNITSNINELKKALKDFVTWYCTTYYNHSSSFGTHVSSDLTLSKQIDSAEQSEKVIIAANGTKIYGVNITSSDLNAKNVGIGFMQLKNTKVKPNDVYQQLLFSNNSVNTSALDIYQQGIELTNASKVNMLDIANKSFAIIDPSAQSKIWYDDDGIGTNKPQEITLNDSDPFTKFNKWLNQEDFFWGREHLEQSDLDKYVRSYWLSPANPTIQKYKSIIETQGYKSHWENKNTINGSTTGTITGNEALAGAVKSLEDYTNFKNTTDPLYNSMFNQIKDYVLSPYNYNIREDIGVGMEGPRGSCQFQYNCDPYYSLPKWSISSLTTHEGKMGHHTQQEYWTEYLQGKDGSNQDGPGYTFVNDAFHEGWAVFTEWYANELGVYGSDLNANTRMPQNWLNAKGLIPNFDKDKKVSELTQTMKNLHNGVYYLKAKGNDNSDEKLQNAITLGNMLQYYGFLNESQLRNMRLCVDVAYHHSSSDSESVTSNNELPLGASIKQVRDYISKNSALSIGDINSESVRYLVMPSQATGYMLGKIVFEELYKAVEAKLNTSLSSNSSESKRFFDLVLKNGEIPLEVLQNQVKKCYSL